MTELLSPDFRKLFARRPVEVLAGPRSFERVLLYAANGRVGKRTATAETVTAKVRGSSSYKVKLWVEDGTQGYSCSCPVGDEGLFCKHAVAVALVVTDAVAGEVEPEPIDLSAYLMAMDHRTLVDLVLERVDVDELFAARLRLAAARDSDGPVSAAVFRNAIDEAFVTHDFVHFGEMYDYTANIRQVLATLRELLGDGHAEVVIDLALHAADRAEDAVGYVDDSDGYLSGIAEDLAALHRDACLAAPPDPVQLAATLFEREMTGGDLDVFYGAATRYADVLGASGLAEYRRQAQKAWATLPALGPGDKRGYDAARSRVTNMMLALAEVDGDVDGVVAVLAHDQSSAYQFVLIVERLRKARRYKDALAWAEQGLALYGFQDLRLVDVALEEYQRARRPGDAVALAWRAYDDRPSPQGYERLCVQAEHAGVWGDWREKALTRLRKHVTAEIAASKKTRVLNSWSARDASALVSVFLFEKDLEQAWVQANAAGCSRALWVQLATLRGPDHPAEVIPIWQREVESAIDQKNNQAYTEAVGHIARIRGLMIAADRGEDFPGYTAALRAKHKPKRNLMKLFDERHW